jgi:hypothetical protein
MSQTREKDGFELVVDRVACTKRDKLRGLGYKSHNLNFKWPAAWWDAIQKRFGDQSNPLPEALL